VQFRSSFVQVLKNQPRSATNLHEEKFTPETEASPTETLKTFCSKPIHKLEYAYLSPSECCQEAAKDCVVNKLFTIVALTLTPVSCLLAVQGVKAPVRANPATNPVQRSAGTLYSKHCASCHGKDGRSKTFKAKFNHARNLTEQGWQDAVSDERIFNSIANGRGGKMPAFSKKMKEAEIDSLVSLVRRMRSS
jgi:cytochrome c553